MIEKIKLLPQEIIKSRLRLYITIGIITGLIVIPIIVVVIVGEPKYVKPFYNPFLY